MKEFKYLQKLFFLLVMGFSLCFVCIACGDEEEDEPFDGPNQEQTDNNGNGTGNGGTSPTDSIMSPTDDPVLPNDSIASGEDDPMIPADSILVIGGHEAVDLGLSVKWATCNVGASSPEEYGDYFAWGETTTKSSYDEDNSITYNLSASELQSRGIIDADGNLTAAYDAATANWGSSWRMPTLDEIKELVNKCTWEWTTLCGVAGRKITSPNGNSIFLPASGERYRTDLRCVGTHGLYWSDSPNNERDIAYFLCLDSSGYLWSYDHRNYGFSVRPVLEQ